MKVEALALLTPDHTGASAQQITFRFLPFYQCWLSASHVSFLARGTFNCFAIRPSICFQNCAGHFTTTEHNVAVSCAFVLYGAGADGVCSDKPSLRTPSNSALLTLPVLTPCLPASLGAHRPQHHLCCYAEPDRTLGDTNSYQCAPTNHAWVRVQFVVKHVKHGRNDSRHNRAENQRTSDAKVETVNLAEHGRERRGPEVEEGLHEANINVDEAYS